MTYLAYGVAFNSDLPVALPTVERGAELAVEQLAEPVDQDLVDWFEPDPDGWCDAGQIGQDYYISFDQEAEFVVAADGSSIGWHSFVDHSPTLTHLLLDHVLPRALTRRGLVVVHGSCLSFTEGSCFAVVGDSGQGKSTLAAALTARGHRFLADDCVAIDWSGQWPTAAPAYPELRLDRHSVGLAGLDGLVDVGHVTRSGTKQRMALPDNEAGAEGPHRLTAAFVLQRADDDAECPVAGPPLGPARSTVELLSHSFHLNHVAERASALDRFAAIAEGCEVRVLNYHHSAAGLSAATAEIERLVSRPDRP